jgi:hypothetical protein
MITLEEVCGRFPDLALQEAALWIERQWLRAEPAPDGGWMLTEVDVARLTWSCPLTWCKRPRAEPLA